MTLTAAEAARLQRNLSARLWTQDIALQTGSGSGNLFGFACAVESALWIDPQTDAATFVLNAQPSAEPGPAFGDLFPTMAAGGPAWSAADIALEKPQWVYIDAPTDISESVALAAVRKLPSLSGQTALGVSTIPSDGAFFLFGTLDPAALLLPPALRALTGDLPGPHGLAHVAMSSGDPKVILRIPFAAGTAGLGTSVTLDVTSPLYWSHSNTALQLHGTIAIGTAEHLEAVIDVPLNGGSFVGRSAYRLDGGSRLWQTLGIDGLPMPKADIDVELALKPSGRTLALDCVSFDVQLEGDWELIPDVLSLHGISVAATVIDPLGNTGASVRLQAQALLGKTDPIRLTATAMYPTGDFALALVPGASLAGVFTKLGAGADSSVVPSGVTPDGLSIAYNARTKFLQATVTLSGGWAAGPFLLSNLRLRAEGVAARFTLSAQASFAILDIAFSATAEYAADAWSVGATASTDLTLGELVRKIGSTFRTAPRLPGALGDARVHKVSAAFSAAAATDVNFVCVGEFEAESAKPVEFRIALTYSKDSSSKDSSDAYAVLVEGWLFLAGKTFQLAFAKSTSSDSADAADATDAEDETDTWLVAAYAGSDAVDLNDLLRAVSDTGLDAPLTVGITSALFAFHRHVDAATSVSTQAYLFGLSLDAQVSFAGLPLVGAYAGTAAIDHLKLFYASRAVDGADVKRMQTLLGSFELLPATDLATDSVIAASLSLSANVTIDGRTIPVAVPRPEGKSASPTPAPAAANGPAAGAAQAPASSSGRATAIPSAAATGATWIAIDAKLGPIDLQKAGLAYTDGRLWLLLTAALSAGGLALEVDGLGLGLRISNPRDVDFTLSGLSLEYRGSSAVELSGSFGRHTTAAGDDEFVGQALVKAATYSLAALGGYLKATDKHAASFFVFARLDSPLGGPPYFFVTGVAAGFGVNRNLKLPAIDALPKFPLLPKNTTFPIALKPDDGAGLDKVLNDVEQILEVRDGQNWLAAGVDFTSYETAVSSVLLTVSFGVKLEIALLGLTHITVPKGAESPVAFAELALEARFSDDAGLIAIDGRLTPASFIYSGACHLTGGFAFYTWFAGENAGDFVVSLGGYHPHFLRPPHYPDVPRLGMIYALGNLKVKGESYFAQTPHVLMAGVKMEATWGSGDLRAWFNAGVDFLLGWKPFHYEASAYIHLGASFSLDLYFFSVTITIHVGVDLALWGPPFGGEASIDLDIISFTVSFGPQPQHEAVDWKTFKTSFLPADAAGTTHVAGASVETGLLDDCKRSDPNAFFSWVLDPNHFALVSKTLVPAKQLACNGVAYAPAADARWTTDFGILPMQLEGAAFQSAHDVELQRLAPGTDHTLPANYRVPVTIGCTPVLANIPAALWAAKDPGLNGAMLVEGAPVGLRLTPQIERPARSVPADLWAMLFDETHAVAWATAQPPIERADPFDVAFDAQQLRFRTRDGNTVVCSGYALSALSDEANPAVHGIAKRRAEIVQSLRELGLSFGADAAPDVRELATFPLWDWPMLRALGAEIPA